MELKEAIKDKLKYEKMEAQDIDLPMDEKKTQETDCGSESKII